MLTAYEEECIEVYRRIAQRGLKLAQELYPQMIDLFQHQLDSLEHCGMRKDETE